MSDGEVIRRCVNLPSECGTAKLGFDEELSVHQIGSRVERSVRDGGIDVVLGGSRVADTFG